LKKTYLDRKRRRKLGLRVIAFSKRNGHKENPGSASQPTVPRTGETSRMKENHPDLAAVSRHRVG